MPPSRQHPADPALLPDPMPAEIIALRGAVQPVWIFAYGSLIWNPEFRWDEVAPALLYGWHRRFCLYSHDYRGTRARPGLVLGLDRGGACRGMVFRLSSGSQAEAIDRLWAREMTAPRVYDMRRVRVRIAGGDASAFAFTVRRDHPDYAGRIPLDEAARIIGAASGSRGACRDYLDLTLRRLEKLGIADAALRRLARRAAALA